MKCEHRRLKKNYPFGRKSKPDKVCKDCKQVVTNHELMLLKRNKKKRR